MTKKLAIFVVIIIVLTTFVVIPAGAAGEAVFVPISNSNMSISTCYNLTAVVEAEGKIYQIGGSVGTSATAAHKSDVYAYDLNSNTWQKLASYPIESREMSAVYLNGKIHCVGGAMYAPGTHNQFYVYDIATNKWTRKADFPVKTRGAGIAAVDGKIYVAGGGLPSSGVNNTLYVYAPITNVWTKKANLLTGL